MNIISRIHVKEQLLNEIEATIKDYNDDKANMEKWESIRNNDPYNPYFANHQLGFYRGLDVRNSSNLTYLKWTYEHLK